MLNSNGVCPKPLKSELEYEDVFRHRNHDCEFYDICIDYICILSSLTIEKRKKLKNTFKKKRELLKNNFPKIRSKEYFKAHNELASKYRKKYKKHFLIKSFSCSECRRFCNYMEEAI